MEVGATANNNGKSIIRSHSVKCVRSGTESNRSHSSKPCAHTCIRSQQSSQTTATQEGVRQVHGTLCLSNQRKATQGRGRQAQGTLWLSTQWELAEEEGNRPKAHYVYQPS